MKTLAITLAAGLMAAGSALAQNADALNARQLEQIRAAAATPAPAPVAVREGGRVYVGGSLGWGGAHLDDRAQWSNTLTVGYEFNKNFAVEASVDYMYQNSYTTSNHKTKTHEAGQTAFVNAIAGYPIGRVTPYVLAGAGAGFNGAGDAHKDPEALWNVGGGLSYNLTNNWQLDARYRYIDAWTGTRAAEQAFSLGVNYRF